MKKNRKRRNHRAKKKFNARFLIGVDRARIAARLIEAREMAGIDRRDLVDACGVSRQTVSSWERGVTMGDTHKLQLAAVRLGVSTEWLFTGSGKGPVRLTNGNGSHKFNKLRSRIKYRQNVETSVGWSRRVYEPPFDGALAEINNGIGIGEPFIDGPNILDWWRMPPKFTSGDLRVKDNKTVRIMRVHADTLEPKVKRGSYVMVDMAQTEVIDGLVYAINSGIATVLKVLRVNPKRPRQLGMGDMIRRHPTLFVPKKKVRIIGRVVGQIAHL